MAKAPPSGKTARAKPATSAAPSAPPSIASRRDAVAAIYNGPSLAIRSNPKRIPIAVYSALLAKPNHRTRLDKITVRDESALRIILENADKAGRFNPSALNLDRGIFSRLASVAFVAANDSAELPFKLTKPALTHARRVMQRAAKPKAAPKTAAAPTAKSPRSAIRQSVAGTADTIRSEATRKASEIGDEVGRLYNQATEKALDAARKGKSRAAEGLESLARVIDDSADSVDDKLGKHYGDFARSAAQTVANLAGTLDEKDLEDLVASTRDFVRKSPAVAIGSAAVVGFMLARLLRGNKDA